jgi:hypothetical protein
LTLVIDERWDDVPMTGVDHGGSRRQRYYTNLAPSKTRTIPST